MATHFYLVRHGQSEGNLAHAFLGHTDLPLTAQGRTQAELASHYLVTLTPDVIYSSDLLRAYQTAEPTAEKLALPIHKDEALREIFAGAWEGLAFTKIETEFSSDYCVWRDDIGNACPTDGESVRELALRISSELTRLATAHEGQTVMVFLHATPIRALAALSLGLGIEGMKNQPWASNASVSHFLFEDGAFSLVEYSHESYLGELSTALPKNV